MKRHPIGPDDVVSVQGQYLVKPKDNTRFLMQGIAFPTAVPKGDEDPNGYDAQGWISVLEQLAEETEINTVRVYRMDCLLGNYSEFLDRAAELGIYVIVPLTGPTGDGVLNRTAKAPECYPKSLYDYGKHCIDSFTKYSNILAGMIGNEVMNSLDTWPAAPCVLAYARDLKLYTAQTNKHRPLPLVYAAQHDSMSAEILPEQAMKMTLDYLSCNNESSIDVFGINVESWCSSLQTFEYNEDGITTSDYYALWQALHNTSIPLVFSEMGCSRNLFNRDNGLHRHVRDWAQIPVVLSDMVDTFSGFCAYTYYGNPVFGMMKDHQAWNGHDILDPSPDFENFRQQLHDFHQNASKSLAVPTTSSVERPSCHTVLLDLQEACEFTLYPMDRMPSYYRREMTTVAHSFAKLALGLLVFSAAVLTVMNTYRRRFIKKSERQEKRETVAAKTTYQSISAHEADSY